MEPKQIARYLGAMSIEERVQIIQALLEASPEGLEMLDIAARTELTAGAIHTQMEALMGIEMVSVKNRENAKIFSVNVMLLDQVLDFLFHHYGPGRPKDKPVLENGPA